MGAFVLGVLVGWLTLWLFYTFWVKAGDNDGDCSALKNELELKNRQISSLQTQIASASDKGKSGSSKLAEKSTASVKTTSTRTSTAKPKTNKAAATTSTKKTASKTQTASKAKPKAAATTKKTTTTSTKKTANKTQTASKAKPKTAAKTTSTKKMEAKTSAKKATSSPKRRAKASGDDFTKLSGIGPSMSATLKTLGIDTFEKLAATDDDILRDMLENSGARMNNNKDVMDSWNEQATVAAKGDFAGLKKMQEALKK